MKIPRMCIRTSLWAPPYANVTIYSCGVQVNVTFPVKEKLKPYLNFEKCNTRGYCFLKDGKHYITEGAFIDFSELKEGNDLVSMIANRANEMRLRLKVIRRRAEVSLLNDEIAEAEKQMKL